MQTWRVAEPVSFNCKEVEVHTSALARGSILCE